MTNRYIFKNEEMEKYASGERYRMDRVKEEDGKLSYNEIKNRLRIN